MQVKHEQCEILVVNIERFGTILANSLNETQTKKNFPRNNIGSYIYSVHWLGFLKLFFCFVVISVEKLTSDNVTDINWPDSEMKDNGLFNDTNLHNPSASIMIPADFVEKIGLSSGIGKFN